ncbi:hypothetical protein OESDEN_00224 [Oesophagostomum dentatum]|uniref:Uncharacterized protein n=1 Tax=Oesophagostomum dentatum TaxID=61180 RepID=A0A0B1TR85_OESDE|nr:hypothetical protein OESDEN_00224 [Oesophagostomum dentatum]
MALPAEYDYLAFVCFLCGHFNPAKKFRPSYLPPTSTSAASRDLKPKVTDFRATPSRSSLDQGSDREQADDKEQKVFLLLFCRKCPSFK